MIVTHSQDPGFFFRGSPGHTTDDPWGFDFFLFFDFSCFKGDVLWGQATPFRVRFHIYTFYKQYLLYIYISYFFPRKKTSRYPFNIFVSNLLILPGWCDTTGGLNQETGGTRKPVWLCGRSFFGWLFWGGGNGCFITPQKWIRGDVWWEVRVRWDLSMYICTIVLQQEAIPILS